MAQPNKGLGDHRYVNKVQPRSDPILLYPLPILGTASLPTYLDHWEPGSLKDSHVNHFCGFNHLNMFPELQTHFSTSPWPSSQAIHVPH